MSTAKVNPLPASWQLTLRSLNWAELAIPLAVLSIVLAMITPLPAALLDVLISANITMSVVVLLAAVYVTRATDFSVFPTMLLLMTLFRLALNISSSRLILLQGNTGTRAAGEVIEAFGNFVVGGNYVIGVVIFLVLIAIQYVVINHGAVRISEVTARFTLDAMPGKQMSIDSDLNAGLIDDKEARSRRKALAAEAEFYGAMDGASRFTQRDAIASIIITAINIVAGFLIGVFQHGIEFQRALQTYTVLTIGDGLVTVIPALMISVSGGLIITRTGSDSRLGAEIQKQIFSNYQPLLLASGVLTAMALFPGLPKIPFLLLGGGAGLVGWRLRAAAQRTKQASAPGTVAKSRDDIESLLKVEPLAIEVGLGLVRFVEGGANSVLLKRIGVIRRQFAGELGYLLPPVRVTDNLQLKAREYVILVKGTIVARYELQAGSELAIPPTQNAAPVPGTPTHEPAFNLPAAWVTPDQIDRAKALGCTIVDPVSVLGTHLTEVVRKYACELFSRQDAKRVLDRVGQDQPKLVEDLVPKQLALATVQKVLQNLLRERVPIRDAGTILEAMGDGAAITRNTALLTEYVRQAIRRSIVRPYLNPASDLPAYFVDSEIERSIEAAAEHGEHGSHISLAPQQIKSIVDRFSRTLPTADSALVVITSSGARLFLKQITDNALPALAVIGHNEVPSGVRVICLGTIK
ncbi:MAG TPA: flagellar biosynthesis protein FlhA [Bryobacteraceae bacterium]|jgi:flagellar biosynthesis protein FlhA|nr:flagellar biosynthesis protein FlhA [Bryobacteraceae bacterium]